MSTKSVLLNFDLGWGLQINKPPLYVRMDYLSPVQKKMEAAPPKC